ncbi:MAG: hypothetical protein WC595_03485 [Candidatus Nanoarchaeia archaeon]
MEDDRYEYTPQLEGCVYAGIQLKEQEVGYIQAVGMTVDSSILFPGVKYWVDSSETGSISKPGHCITDGRRFRTLSSLSDSELVALVELGYPKEELVTLRELEKSTRSKYLID